MEVAARSEYFASRDASPIRVRTLTLVRWVAIWGQFVTITLGEFWFGLNLPLAMCYMAVGVSVLVNLWLIQSTNGRRHLTEQEALVQLMFDLVQFLALTALTGGLTNPFALLVLVPVTISASSLGRRSTVILGGVAIVLSSATHFFNMPILQPDGGEVTVPRMLEFGFWVAIVVGILFLGMYSRRIALDARSMSDALLATQMALAREQKLTDLGGVVAAAAHELGTPLATIKLVSAELMNELKHSRDLYEDAKLIRDQADRCRDILHGMGRAGKDDLQLHQTTLEQLLREAADPHLDRGKEVIFNVTAKEDASGQHHNVLRRPEIIHGLRNFIQNAVDFADNRVWVDGEWHSDHLLVRVVDDGRGFPLHLIGRIGDPFVRLRKSEQDLTRRPGYEGMGLGMFIAKTLIERTGATLKFSNASDPFLAENERPERSGAVVEISWPLADIVAPASLTEGPNEHFRI